MVDAEQKFWEGQLTVVAKQPQGWSMGHVNEHLPEMLSNTLQKEPDKSLVSLKSWGPIVFQILRRKLEILGTAGVINSAQRRLIPS